MTQQQHLIHSWEPNTTFQTSFFATCFSCNIGNISRFSSGTCDLRVPFELCVLPNFPSVKRGHRIRRKSREQGIPFHWFDKGVECKWYTAFIFSVCWVFMLVCLNFESLQQGLGVQSGNFASLAYFFNVVRNVENHLYFITRIKMCWARWKNMATCQ